jgi:hypothetical protein
MSLRLNGARIHWDAKNMKVNGIPEAESIVKEPSNEEWDISKIM